MLHLYGLTPYGVRPCLKKETRPRTYVLGHVFTSKSTPKGLICVLIYGPGLTSWAMLKRNKPMRGNKHTSCNPSGCNEILHGPQPKPEGFRLWDTINGQAPYGAWPTFKIKTWEIYLATCNTTLWVVLLTQLQHHI